MAGERQLPADRVLWVGVFTPSGIGAAEADSYQVATVGQTTPQLGQKHCASTDITSSAAAGSPDRTDRRGSPTTPQDAVERALLPSNQINAADSRVSTDARRIAFFFKTPMTARGISLALLFAGGMTLAMISGSSFVDSMRPAAIAVGDFLGRTEVVELADAAAGPPRHHVERNAAALAVEPRPAAVAILATHPASVAADPEPLIRVMATLDAQLPRMGSEPFKAGLNDKLEAQAIEAEQSQPANTLPIQEPAGTLPAATATLSVVQVDEAERQPSQAQPIGGQQAAPAPASPTEEPARVGSAAAEIHTAAAVPAEEAEHRPSQAQSVAVQQAAPAPPASTEPQTTVGSATAKVDTAEQQSAQEPVVAGQKLAPAVLTAEEPGPVGLLAAKTDLAAVTPLAANPKQEVPGAADRETEIFLARGDGFLMTGDLASARLFYEYAAAGGNGLAALRLGGTFDPAFLARLKLRYASGDRDKAVYWYRRARDLGDRDAEILLESVERRGK
jgi:hypothetical protein